MLLAVDVGNTNVVFALYEGEKARGTWRIATDPRRTADEYAVWFSQLLGMDGLKLSDIDGAVIASVVPDVTFNLRRFCQQHVLIPPTVIGDPDVELGISIDVDSPGEVGADRLVNAVAGFERYGGPLIVVDFGTATTFDVIGTDGTYHGGVIAPAAAHSLDALHRTAARLPRVDIAKPERVIGRGTIPAMQSGIFWGYVGLIEGVVARIREEWGAPMRVIATGGLASVFSPSLPMIEAVDPDLTLRGLVMIHRRNR